MATVKTLMQSIKMIGIYKYNRVMSKLPIRVLLLPPNQLADLTKGLVRLVKNSIYPMVDRLIRSVITLPVSTATTERVYPAVKLAKTHIRTKMGDGLCNKPRHVFESCHMRYD